MSAELSEVPIADAAVAFGFLLQPVAATVPLRRGSAALTGAIAGAVVAILAWFAQAVVVAARRLTGHSGLAVRVAAVGQPVAVLVPSVITDPLRDRRRAAVLLAVTLIFTWITETIAADRRRPTIESTIVTVLKAFAEPIAAT